jgi:hypothetical protein
MVTCNLVRDECEMKFMMEVKTGRICILML